MGKINVMNETLANKIAAGEVVERIANVVKELVENSIDAGSENIKIELTESGTKSIKIIDDGCGMSKEDAILCFSRHATSKIKNENDLYFISTLGFRGEALAAISSVSEVTLDTYDGNEATKVQIKYGKFEEPTIGSMRQGTIIEVKNLFYNVPARLKFMKSLNTELNLCVSYIEKISLSHPEISFTLINNDKQIFKTSGSNDIYKTIHEIYGYNTTKNMIKISAENYDYMINGYISNINIQKSNKNNMITLVNGRVVTNQNVNRTIKDAYHTVLADNKYPVVVLYIETDPTLIDVNIHPTKQDIKFSKLENLNDLLFTTIRQAINKTDNTFKAYQEEKVEINKEEKEEIKQEKVIEEVRLNLNVEEEVIEYNEEELLKENTFIKPVGLALGTYLIAHDENIMYMIDIHAANERINYEKYMKNLEEQQTYTTNMLFPLQFEYAHNEFLKLKDNIEFIRTLGFEIDEFGTNTYRVTSHPSWLKEGYEEESIKKIFELIIEISDKFDRVKFNEAAATRLACKMSVKANTNIGYLEQEELINNLFKCDFPYTCPHGRPTIIKYPIYELEKLFKRVNS
ncbi:MAG: DNA mismatch repair endonuclease MutL [Bacilli bacterium]|nr:DNA mismatch repair endonuclease MutL [Bacilli bacterium]